MRNLPPKNLLCHYYCIFYVYYLFYVQWHYNIQLNKMNNIIIWRIYIKYEKYTYNHTYYGVKFISYYCLWFIVLGIRYKALYEEKVSEMDKKKIQCDELISRTFSCFFLSFRDFFRFLFQPRWGRKDRQNESYASRKRISHILFLLPHLFSSRFDLNPEVGVRIAYSCTNVESVWRRARKLQGRERERKRNARKFARLPLGMMNESFYLFYSQISFWLLKERDAGNSTRGKRAWRGLSFTIPRVYPHVCRSLLLRLSILSIHRRRVI